MIKRSHSTPVTLALALALALAGTGCKVAPVSPMQASEAVSGRDPAAFNVQEGEKVYRRYCVGCHGENGDGKGTASRFLDPRPRDFTTGIFKFASVPSGQLPRDEDLIRTITKGFPGSSMPSWQLLPESEKVSLVAYIKTFSTQWTESRPGAPVAVSEDPWGTSDPQTVRDAIDRGKVVYHVLATCWQCHRSYATTEEVTLMATAEGTEIQLREGVSSPQAKPDAWGNMLLPTDFPMRRLKRGSSLQDLYRTIASGVGGTAMPMWKEGLPERDLWALAYYVKSLADERWREPNAIASPPFESLVSDVRSTSR